MDQTTIHATKSRVGSAGEAQSVSEDSIDFLQAVMISCDGLTILAKRYTDEARRLAAQASSDIRRDELLKIVKDNIG